MNSQSFTLIDGDFTPSEAGTIILDLINSKIRYHNLEVLNCMETGMGDALHSRKRIQELEEVRQRLNALLRFASSNNKYLKINGTFEVELAEVPISEAVKQD
jgi:hypothetical protein